MLDLRYLPVGDPARMLARKALLAALSVGTIFVVFALISTQDKAVRAHSPWQDDPFDVVVSFTLFLVPLLLAALLLRAQLCRRDEPLPARRLSDLLRCAQAAVVAIGLTVATDWSAVALGEHRSEWGLGGVALLGGLGLITLAAAGAGLALRRARPGRQVADCPGPDWVEDILLYATQRSTRLGRLSPTAIRLVARLSRVTLHPRLGIRRHPVAWALLAAATFGLSLAVAQGVGEHAFSTPVSAFRAVALFGLIGTAGMFALLVTVGRYLRVVGPADGSIGHRRAVAVGLAAAVSVPVTVAFRAELSWLTADLIALIAALATAAGIGALAVTFIVGVRAR